MAEGAAHLGSVLGINAHIFVGKVGGPDGLCGLTTI